MRTYLAGVIALLLIGCTGEPPEPVTPLVDAAWLSEHLDEVVVLDVRFGAPQYADRQAFEKGHVPGAVYANYAELPWRAVRDGVPGMLPPAQDMEKLIGGLGVSNDDHVVIVAGGISPAEMAGATRVYWTFKVLGHDAVSILDGGYAAWVRGGYPVESGWNEPAPTTFQASYRPDLVASKEDVIAALDGGVPLIDARPETYYRGERKSRVAKRYGTIAGAVNVPLGTLMVDGRGTFVDAATARAIWAEAGVPTEGDQVTFCNTGHMASLDWFVAHEILGNKDTRLYDGSLAEWSADASLPMEASAAEPAVR